MHALVERYGLVHSIQPASLAQLEYTARDFASFLGRDLVVPDLNDDQVNRYLVWLAGKKLAHATVKSRRRGLLSLWRSEAEDGTVAPPRRIRRLAPMHSIPRAWTPAQVSAIIAECDKLPGHFRGSPVERRLFAKAFFLTAYETGFRRSDLLRIRRPQIEPSGLIVLVQHKTGQPHLARIRPETLAAIDLLGTTGRETVFGGVLGISSLSDLCGRVLKAAGVDGSLKWFRRSGATHVEMATPGAGWRFLGHTSPRVAQASYLDPLQLGREPLIPPKLPGE